MSNEIDLTDDGLKRKEGHRELIDHLRADPPGTVDAAYIETRDGDRFEIESVEHDIEPPERDEFRTELGGVAGVALANESEVAASIAVRVDEGTVGRLYKGFSNDEMFTLYYDVGTSRYELDSHWLITDIGTRPPEESDDGIPLVLCELIGITHPIHTRATITYSR